MTASSPQYQLALTEGQVGTIAGALRLAYVQARDSRLEGRRLEIIDVARQLPESWQGVVADELMPKAAS